MDFAHLQRLAGGTPPVVDHESGFSIGQFSAGQQIGYFKVLRRLGSGGMAVVYLALDGRLGRRVALKLQRQFSGMHEMQLRFLREARLAAGLQHPHIIQVQEVGQVAVEGLSHPLNYLSMSFVEGGTLADLAGTPLRSRLELLCQAADGVGHAHREGVIHRDLKPSNILVDSCGRAIVTDFGLARAPDEQTLTATGTLLGTPQYMAPEQVRCQSVDARADVWALGVMLYQMLYGRLPFLGRTVGQLYSEILKGRPSFKEACQYPGLEGVVRRALAVSPEQRYPDGCAFAEVLCRALTTDSGRGSLFDLSRVLSLRQISRSRLALLLLLVLVTLSLALAGWWSDRRTLRFDTLRATAERAYKAGDWTESIVAGQNALRLRRDDSLAALVAASRGRIQASQVHDKTQLLQLERQQALARRVASLRRQIEEAHALSYRKGSAILEKWKRLQTVLLAFETEVTEESKNQSAWRIIGHGWCVLGRLQRAERCFQRALAVGPRDGWIVHQLGRINLTRSLRMFHYQGETAQVRAARDRALQLFQEPGKPWSVKPMAQDLARAFLALARDQREPYTKIIEQIRVRHRGKPGIEEMLVFSSIKYTDGYQGKLINLALRIRPHYPLALVIRGTIRLDEGDPEGARADFDRALELNPEFPTAYHARASLLLVQGAYKETLAECDRGLRVDEHYGPLHGLRGYALLLLGRPVDARAAIDHTIRLDPLSGLAYYYRGQIQNTPPRTQAGPWCALNWGISRAP